MNNEIVTAPTLHTGTLSIVDIWSLIFLSPPLMVVSHVRFRRDDDDDDDDGKSCKYKFRLLVA